MLPAVNEDGEVVGMVAREVAHSRSFILHPVVHLHVFDSGGRLFLQKRPQWKDVQPGKWDTAVGGHVDCGEDIGRALRREVAEEIGIEGYVPEPVGRYVFRSDVEAELVHVFKTTFDGAITPDSEELDDGRFWTAEEIRQAMGRGVFTPNFESEYKRFFSCRL